eukprot:353445-Chlamydomonas_euryale.AAC.7
MSVLDAASGSAPSANIFNTFLVPLLFAAAFTFGWLSTAHPTLITWMHACMRAIRRHECVPPFCTHFLLHSAPCDPAADQQPVPYGSRL